MKAMPFSQRMARLAPASGAARSVTTPLVVTGLLWLAAGLSIGYWVLQSVGRGSWEPVPALASSVPQADTATVARALGATVMVAEAPEAPAPQTRYQLWGMVAQPARQDGAALIAVDDEPPRPIQVGDNVSEGLVLQSVTKGIVRLGPSRQGPTTIELTLPAAPAVTASVARLGPSSQPPANIDLPLPAPPPAPLVDRFERPRARPGASPGG